MGTITLGGKTYNTTGGKYYVKGTPGTTNFTVYADSGYGNKDATVSKDQALQMMQQQADWMKSTGQGDYNMYLKNTSENLNSLPEDVIASLSDPYHPDTPLTNVKVSQAQKIYDEYGKNPVDSAQALWNKPNPNQTTEFQTTVPKPQPGSGTYVEDLAKYNDQGKTLGDVTGGGSSPAKQPYKVPSGSNLTASAQAMGITLQQLLDANPQYKANPNMVQAGASLQYPGTSIISAQNNAEGANNANAGATTQTPAPTPVVGTSEQARAAKTAELAGGANAPAPFKSVDYYQQLRTEQGVVNDESELADIQKQQALIKEDLRQMSTQTGELSMGGYTGKMSEEQTNANFKLEGLATQETAVTNRINTKNSYISTMVNLAGQDYTTAKSAYDDTFNKNLQVEQLLNTETNNAQQDAKTALTTMVQGFQDSGITWDKLSPTMQAQITTNELAAGLPQGFTQQVLTNADKPIQATIISDSKDVATIIYKDGTTKQISTGITPSPTLNTKNNQLKSEIDNSLKNNNLIGGDKKVSWETYRDMLLTWINNNGTQSEFLLNYPTNQWLDTGNQKEFQKYLGKTGTSTSSGGLDFNSF